jgi:hypothetical protein
MSLMLCPVRDRIRITQYMFARHPHHDGDNVLIIPEAI